MAGRIRTIKPELLEDEKTASLSHEAWRLFVSLMLVADDHGRFRANPAHLNGAAFWGTKADVPSSLQELDEKRLVQLYRVKGQAYGRIRGWAKHQKVDRPGPPRCPGPDESDDSPHCGTDSRAIRSDRDPAREPFSGSAIPLATDHDHDHDQRPEYARSSGAGSEPTDSWEPDSGWEPDGDCGDEEGPRTARATHVATEATPPGAKRPAKAKHEAKPDLPVEDLTPVEASVHDALVADPDLAPICQRPAQLARDLVKAGPGVDVARDVRTAGAWLRANPKKAKKKGNAFLLSWICRSQERGGGLFASNRPMHQSQDPPVKPIEERQLTNFMDRMRNLKPGAHVR